MKNLICKSDKQKIKDLILQKKIKINRMSYFDLIIKTN
jgi:hypothetical protein